MAQYIKQKTAFHIFFFFKQKTAYEISACLVGSEMCIRDRIQKDKNGKAWMIMGVVDIAPDQTPMERIRRTVINRKTGEMLPSAVVPANQQLTKREKEILLLIRQGFLSKEIAYKLNLSIYTVNNHRKNILAKLNADNVIEAINRAESSGILY